MKKTIIALASLLLLTGCINETSDGHLTTTDGLGSTLKLVDVEFDGEVHQYVLYEAGYGRSLSHWEGCKYCKEKENED